MNDTLNSYQFTLTTWGGESVSVDYRLPPLSALPEYLEKEADDSAMLEYLCGKEKGFADRFTDESIYQLLDKVGEQMDPRKAAWISRQAAKIKRVKENQAKLGLMPKSGTAS